MPRANTVPVARAAIAAVSVLAAFAAAAALRYLWIEPERFGHACVVTAAPWWCAPRVALIDFLWGNGLGVASVASAAGAILSGSKRLATIAMTIGAAGLVLYGYDWSAVGLLAALLVLASQRERRPENAQ